MINRDEFNMQMLLLKYKYNNETQSTFSSFSKDIYAPMVVIYPDKCLEGVGFIARGIDNGNKYTYQALLDSLLKALDYGQRGIKD